MEKKDRPTVEEGFVQYLRSQHRQFPGIKLIAYLYGELDVYCPPEAIVDMVAVLETCLEYAPQLEDMIQKATDNLQVQFNEYAASMDASEVVAEKPASQSEEKFQNLADPWSREGIFLVELERNLIPRLTPSSSSWITVEKKKDRTVITFRIKGKIKSSEGLMRIHVGADHFIWRRGSIKAVRNEEGSLLYKKGASRLPKPVASATP